MLGMRFVPLHHTYRNASYIIPIIFIRSGMALIIRLAIIYSSSIHFSSNAFQCQPVNTTLPYVSPIRARTICALSVPLFIHQLPEQANNEKIARNEHIPSIHPRPYNPVGPTQQRMFPALVPIHAKNSFNIITLIAPTPFPIVCSHPCRIPRRAKPAFSLLLRFLTY